MLASVIFILGIKRLSSVKTARQGNIMASVAMLIAIATTLIELRLFQTPFDFGLIIIGIIVGTAIGAWMALKVEMTEMPQMVAMFNGLGGGASLLVALSYFWEKLLESPANANLAPYQVLGTDGAISMLLSILIGGVTLTGSVIAYGKLQGVKWVPDKPVLFPGRHALNAALFFGSFGLGYLTFFGSTSSASMIIFLLLMSIVCLILGVLLVVSIGGADMPVVISLLNSYSGLAAAMTGFIISNNVLIISGSLVGASGIILTNIMCKAMNRSLTNVLFGGFGGEDSGSADNREYSSIKSTGAEEVAMVLDACTSVIVVPGYGMAVAQAQHAVRELGDLLQKRGCSVKYAIHPVAGRMPGHMNVLLAEASIPYEQLVEMDDINSEFKNTDMAIILGANDVVNPDALDKKDSPIYGMPILHVHEAKSVVVIKRSLSPGFAKIRNPLFEAPNAMMFFSDGRKAIEDLVREVKDL
tara:strand:- start:10566 stop:11978 length:1413 start_codon:yes stop_codon:yes gene_type:complete